MNSSKNQTIMNEYVPACKIYTDDPFAFEAIEWEVDDTWEVEITITHDSRCASCFLLEDCLAKVEAVMNEAFELEEEENPDGRILN